MTFAALLVAALFAGACGSSDNDNNNTTPPGDNTGTPGGTVPGSGIDADPLNVEVQSADVPASGRPTVTFKVTDKSGTPIDLAAEFANANTSPATLPNTIPRFTLAMLTDAGDYVSYYVNSRTAAAYTYTPENEKPTPSTGAVTQASTVPRTSGTPAVYPVADLESLGNGVYRFTLPPPEVTTGMDRSKTHTIAAWVVRTKPGGDQDIAVKTLNFVPAGGTAQLEETITDAGCNKCHGVVQAHGTRRGTQFCLTCHSPQTTDPETARTVDFKVMIHKIHYGASLPSVQQGIPYFIVGNRQSVHEWSEVAFPWHDGVSHCTACHSGEDVNSWKTKASLAACTACHDNVKFDGTGIRNCELGAAPAGANWWDNCNHPDISSLGDVNNPTICQTCHTSTNALLAVERFHHGDQPP